MCKIQCVNGSASQTSWMDQLDRPAGRTNWMDQLDGPAGQTSSFYLKPWPIRIFEDFPFSLYIVAASESDEGLVSIRKAKLVLVVEGNGRNSSNSPQNYNQTLSFSLQNYDKTSSLSLQKQYQRAQDLELNGYFLLTGGLI